MFLMTAGMRLYGGYSGAPCASMSQKASYLTHVAEARDQMDWNPEFSRRGRGFATYAAIRQLGRSGVAELVERCCDHAHALVTRMGALPGAEMVWEPIINQGLVRFLDPAGRDDERFYGENMAEILATGEERFRYPGPPPGAWTWRTMRVSVSIDWRDLGRRMWSGWFGALPGCWSGLVRGDPPPPCFPQSIHSMQHKSGLPF